MVFLLEGILNCLKAISENLSTWLSTWVEGLRYPPDALGLDLESDDACWLGYWKVEMEDDVFYMLVLLM